MSEPAPLWLVDHHDREFKVEMLVRVRVRVYAGSALEAALKAKKGESSSPASQWPVSVEKVTEVKEVEARH